MTKGRLLLKPNVALLVANRKSKLFIIDITFGRKLINYLMENNIRLVKAKKFI